MYISTKHYNWLSVIAFNLQQLYIFINDIINSNTQTDVIYLNFRKAFDSVRHTYLLHKLYSLGKTGHL